MGQPMLSQHDVTERLHGLGHDRFVAVREVAQEGGPDGIGAALIFALGLRETGIRNIEGDGGYGKGWLQVDRRAFPSWLKAHAGCRSGHWTFSPGHRAWERGYVPGLTAGTHLAITLLRGNRAGAHRAHVPSSRSLRVAIAGYNCGLGNALAAYREHGLGGVDARTTGRDYSRWVLAVESLVVHAAGALGWSLD